MATPGETKEEIHVAGTTANVGSFVCADCSFPISLAPEDEMPDCPNCGGTRFHRASMFEQPTLRRIVIDHPAVEPEAWLGEVRESVDGPGKYLAAYVDGRTNLIELGDGWSKVGRSRSADIRLDDPTVSRRHAVIVKTPEGKIRVLDDRSMNGISVNGEQVDWSPLGDGDELQIGRYTLHVIDVPNAAD